MRLKAIIFDWAGTVVDFGCLCPVEAIQAAFQAKGIIVAAKDINRFMGIHKREHVRAVLSLPAVTTQWRKAYGKKPDSSDVNLLHEMAEQRMLETVESFAMPTPYLSEAIKMTRKQGLKIGSTTGYTSLLMEKLVPVARQQGFAPDFWIASDQVPKGRPWPWMIFKNMEYLEVYPPAAIVKLGDTVADVEEANNAGIWSVAVVESSSLVGKSRSELEALPARERNSLIREASKQLTRAGAHSVIKNLSQLEATLEQIDERLEKGQLPPQLAHRRRNGSD
jgi:phosphonoacetaldehyde hydrolase